MEEKEKVDEKEEKGSNSCVMDLSIDGGGEEKENNDEKKEGNILSLNKSFDDIKNFTKKLNLKDNFENILDIEDDSDLTSDDNKIRSKTFVIKNTSITGSQIK